MRKLNLKPVHELMPEKKTTPNQVEMLRYMKQKYKKLFVFLKLLNVNNKTDL